MWMQTTAVGCPVMARMVSLLAAMACQISSDARSIQGA
jgi:hypothetical protein